MALASICRLWPLGLALAAVAAGSFLPWGVEGLVSSALAIGSYLVPTALVSLVCSRASGALSLVPSLFLVGIFARTLGAAGLMLLSAMLYDGLVWPAFLLSLFVVINVATMGPVLLKNKD